MALKVSTEGKQEVVRVFPVKAHQVLFFSLFQ